VSDRYLYAGLLGFGVGVFLRSFFHFGFSFSVFLVFLGIVIFFYIFARQSGETFRPLLFLPVFLCALGLGFLRFDVSDLGRGDPALLRAVDTTVSLQGVITSEPDEREGTVKLTVSLEKLFAAGGEEAVGGKILLTADLPNSFHYGDRIKFSGTLRTPRNFGSGEGAPVFDYVSYLAKDGIYYEMFRPRLSLVSSGNGNIVSRELFRLKEAFVGNIGKVVPEPHASLLDGLVVGAKQSLGKSLLDDFRVAGVIHIVVLSGYNITIVAEAIMKFFAFLPQAFGLSFGAVGIILFAIMTGGSATVVRASLMALLVVLSQATGREYKITRALLLAGFFMVLQNPRILVFDASFQLSFLSTIALIYVSPLIEPRLWWITEKCGLRGIITATVATQIFVLPLLLYKTGMLSLVALPVNLLILPLIPVTMFFGFFAGVSAFLWTVLALPFAYLAYLLLAYELSVVEFFSHLPFAAVAVNNVPLWLVPVTYLVYVLIYLRFRPTPKTGRGGGEKIISPPA
jgi:competence protein ComEC